MLSICDRWHVLPSQVLAEPAETLRMLRIEALARPAGGGEVDGG